MSFNATCLWFWGCLTVALAAICPHLLRVLEARFILHPRITHTGPVLPHVAIPLLTGALLYEFRQNHGAASVLLLGGNASTVNDMEPWTVLFQTLGFHVFVLEYAGFGLARGPHPDLRSLVRDAHAALDKIQHISVLLGVSMGGGVAVEVLARRTDFPKQLVLFNTFDCLRRIAHEHMPVLGLCISETWDKVPRLQQILNVDSNIRILLVGTENDPIVKVHHTLRMAGAMKECSRCDVVILPGSDHFASGVTHANRWTRFLTSSKEN